MVSALLCIVGPRAVDRVQSLIVVGLLAVFAVFIVATLADLKPHLLAPSGYPPLSSAVVLIVFAVDTFQDDKKAFWTMLALPLLAAALDAAWKRRRAAPPPVASP